MTRLPLATIVVSTLAITNTAHAMGSDVSFAVEAWNADGSAVLLSQLSTREGGETRQYVIVTTTDAKPEPVLVSDRTKEGPGKFNQSVDAAECTRSAGDLERALRTKKFRTVTVHADRCKTDKRDVVTVDAAGMRDVELSWVPMPQMRTASAREQAAEAVLKIAIPSYHTRPLDYACEYPIEGLAEVSAQSSQLLLVFAEDMCNAPARTKVRVFVPKAKSFSLLVELI